MILELYQKSESQFVSPGVYTYIYVYTYENIYNPGTIQEYRIRIRRLYTYIIIDTYTYEHIYDPGIIREIRICFRREYTYTYIYEKSEAVFAESIYIYTYIYMYHLFGNISVAKMARLSEEYISFMLFEAGPDIRAYLWTTSLETEAIV